jgi:alkylation response protein AidB-like acyl-CoA dehydrogenase
MAVPEEYGGTGLGVLDTALVLEEIAKVCYVTAMAMGEVGVQTRIISAYAPEHIKQRILPKVCTGEAMLAVCMTEPHAGTDVAQYRTNATIKGDKVILKGVKTLISRVDEAAMFVVFSRIDGKPGREGIGCVLIEKDTPGFVVTNRYHTWAARSWPRSASRIASCGRECVVREDGFRSSSTRSTPSAASTEHLARARRGRVRGSGQVRARPHGVQARRRGFQGMRWKLAEMYRDIEVGRSMLYRACLTANLQSYEAAIAKMYCNEMAIRVTSEALQVHGGYGFTDEYPVSGCTGARYGTLGGGTTETLKDLVGKMLVSDFSEVEGFLGLKTF